MSKFIKNLYFMNMEDDKYILVEHLGKEPIAIRPDLSRYFFGQAVNKYSDEDDYVQNDTFYNKEEFDLIWNEKNYERSIYRALTGDYSDNRKHDSWILPSDVLSNEYIRLRYKINHDNALKKVISKCLKYSIDSLGKSFLSKMVGPGSNSLTKLADENKNQLVILLSNVENINKSICIEEKKFKNIFYDRKIVVDRAIKNTNLMEWTFNNIDVGNNKSNFVKSIMNKIENHQRKIKIKNLNKVNLEFKLRKNKRNKVEKLFISKNISRHV